MQTSDGMTYRGRYWSPTVLIRGSLAAVWAPYEFWIDGRTSHCGVDVFDCVKTCVPRERRLKESR
jgi:hypothetical protein